MAILENPAWKAFAAQLGSEFELAQVLIRRRGTGFELRHVADRTREEDSLRLLKTADARALAQTNAAGEFRPLKSAPNLQSGWRIVATDEVELELALSRIYPGAIADWHAARSANPPVTNYREFAARQSGMYRLLAMLDDAEAGKVIRVTCDAKLCLKRRLWTVEELAPDEANGKSVVPCLEPCAILMESARKAVRAAQEANLRPAPELAAEPENG